MANSSLLRHRGHAVGRYTLGHGGEWVYPGWQGGTSLYRMGQGQYNIEASASIIEARASIIEARAGIMTPELILLIWSHFHVSAEESLFMENCKYTNFSTFSGKQCSADPKYAIIKG